MTLEGHNQGKEEEQHTTTKQTRWAMKNKTPQKKASGSDFLKELQARMTDHEDRLVRKGAQQQNTTKATTPQQSKFANAKRKQSYEEVDDDDEELIGM